MSEKEFEEWFQEFLRELESAEVQRHLASLAGDD